MVTVVRKSSDGEAVVAWTNNSDVRLQKLDADGIAQWGAGVTIPAIGGDSTSASDLDFDPDPGRRPPALSAGHGEINRRLAESIEPSDEPLTEQVTTLFVAPPDVCEAAKRTVLYGVLPVTSPETSEEPRVPIYTEDEASQTLSILLKSSSAKARSRSNLKWLGKTLRAETWEAEPGIKALRVCLQQLLVSFDAFGESAESRQLFGLVNEIRLDYGTAGEKGAADVLKVAAHVLIHRRLNLTSRFNCLATKR